MFRMNAGGSDLYLRLTFRSALIILIVLTFFSAAIHADTWFNERVAWKYGKEGIPWETTVKNPNGSGSYRLVLRPLWSVEGGVLALEIVLARPDKPDVNLFGERDNHVEYPFVITVHELEKGLVHSKFGKTRKLGADDVTLDVTIDHFRLGSGVGSGSIYCAKCKNLQELTLSVTVKDKDVNHP